MKTFAAKISLKETLVKNQVAAKQNQTHNLQNISVNQLYAPIVQEKTLCPCDGGCPRCLPVQAKLKIGQPNDKYEQEADRVADQVMRMPEPDMSNVKGEMLNLKGENTLQRQNEETCPECRDEEEETVQPKPIADQINPLIQRQEEPDEEVEEVIQSKAKPGNTPTVTPDVVSKKNISNDRGQPLPDSVRNYFEPRFGYDFSQVRAHKNYYANQLSQDINAQAFTIGRHIYFNSGKFSPDTSSGKRLLAHELVHVIQQKQRNDMVQGVFEDPQHCPTYDPDERFLSYTPDGWLDSDVRLLSANSLLIADFPVGDDNLSVQAETDPILRHWLNTFETDDSYILGIIGYCDCIGSNESNHWLKLRRVRAVENLLGPSARSRVQYRAVAAENEYIRDNSSPENRAMNRSVIIQISQGQTIQRKV